MRYTCDSSSYNTTRNHWKACTACNGEGDDGDITCTSTLQALGHRSRGTRPGEARGVVWQQIRGGCDAADGGNGQQSWSDSSATWASSSGTRSGR